MSFSSLDDKELYHLFLNDANNTSPYYHFLKGIFNLIEVERAKCRIKQLRCTRWGL